MGEDFYYPQNGTQGDLRSIVRMNDTLYVGGDFLTNGVEDLTYLAWWNGSNWLGLNNTVNDNVYALAADENYLYAGGRFTIAGNSGSAYFGRYTPGVATDIIDNDISLNQSFTLNQNYPNPFNPNTKIRWQSPVGGWQTLKVYDILGNELATLVNEYKPDGSYEIDFQSTVGSHQLANGVYFYRLRVGDFVETKKMILLK
jgi:hypothetical protein